ncbi:unnamed protein product [Tuber melanosporum]|uniref:(Perigord truffle) hypothetical protein n=1 Tax=Tuber melanosporum (strain Mel28) TaxID=656061 RepID=D5G6A1_TUBMM|nr:uncharacterized protein GSTUM_00001673001 [Tuber melanosporum]CAZ80044.1 unnamed protein product [Tuber melanosporum]
MALSALPRPASDNDSLYFMESSSNYWHVGQSFSPEIKERVSTNYNSSLLTGLPMLSTSQSPTIPREASLMSIREEFLQIPGPNSFVNSVDGGDDKSLSGSLISNGSIGTMETAPQFPGSPREPSVAFAPSDTKELPCGAPGFQKWLKSLCCRRLSLRPNVHTPFQGDDPDDDDWAASIFSLGMGDEADSSSFKFVTAAKTASITFASMSLEDESPKRKNSVALDSDTIARMRDRKCALEELINTEEYYIADLKVLVNLYMSILNDCEGIPADIRDAITRNISEILCLHEKLLEEIFHALPAASHQIQTYKGRSFDVGSQADEFTGSNVLANPMAAAKVAMVFDRMIRGFFVYEEYCAKYELVCEKFKEFRGSSWSLRERGCETLAGAISSQDNREEYGKRALALADMLVKPIQRICKYPLLFAEIVKCTPAMDCPESNQLLDKVRFRLEEAAHQINLAAVNGPKIRDRMEKTWLLQDRLNFKYKPDCSIRLLGQIFLCGALHVAWQGPTIPVGEYMACLLYKSYLLLARVPKSGGTYDVKFAISLGTARMEEANQGQGLNCYSALFSWKIIFEAGHRIYEVLLSACSATEEEVWRNRIAECIAEESKDYDEYSSAKSSIIPVVISDMRSLGHVFGRPGTLARRQSLHRPRSTPLPKSDVIIINNTHALSEVIGPKSTSGLSRSASVLHAGQMTVLSPKRTERNRIELKLTDVWTRDQLAYGLMASGGVRRRDASNLMKRLSAASLVSSARKSMHSLHMSSSSSEASWTQSWDIAGDADPGILMGVPLNATDRARTPNSHPHGVGRRGYTLSRAFSFSGRSNDLKSVLRRSGSSSLESKSEEALKGSANAAAEELKPAEVCISVSGPDEGARRKRRSLRPRRLRGLGLD